MVSRLQPIRIKLAYMLSTILLSTIYKYTANRFKCRLPTSLQQKIKWPPTIASTTNWISRIDQATRTRLVLQPVIQAYRVTPLLTYRSQVITSLSTPPLNRAEPSSDLSPLTHLTSSSCLMTNLLLQVAGIGKSKQKVHQSTVDTIIKVIKAHGM